MPDLWMLYTHMLRSRLFEESVAQLWHDGQISGEMHLGTGEEAINAGIVSHLRQGDAMALDHRGTGPLLMRGEDPVRLVREFLGRADGLCGGMGGHMHLFSKRLLCASSGIVGASGPAAAGFALAAEFQRPGAVAVAFFGDGALNQGMLMESLVLASAWNLPVVFVCKDDGWAITTRSDFTTGTEIAKRANGCGVRSVDLDGTDVEAVWEVARETIESARSGRGPSLLHARCVHLEGHFLGLQLLRAVRQPMKELPRIALPLARSLLRPGGSSLSDRADGLKDILAALGAAAKDPRTDKAHDPVDRTRRRLLDDDPERLSRVEQEVEDEIRTIFARAVEGEPT